MSTSSFHARLARSLLCAGALAGFAALAGCDDSPDGPGEAVERAGDAAEDAADDAGDAIDDAID